ncbi:MAG: acetyl-CoA C-acyltransferase [Sediminibacterium sp.]|nr:acetyl-CoA C-acyltransferase [Sediminibacterium sp.]
MAAKIARTGPNPYLSGKLYIAVQYNATNMTKDCYVIDMVRTPIGKYGGTLSGFRPDDLLAYVIQSLLKRNPNIDPASIEDIIAGAANQAGEDNRNVARMAGLLAGLPVSVAGATVNRLCASGLQAIMDATRAILCNEGLFYIAAGVESMTRAPFVTAKSSEAFGRKMETFDTTMGWRFINPKLAAMYPPFTMGETAENIARQWKISREKQDEFAFASQEKYATALKASKWDDEMVAVEIMKDRMITWFNQDEHPRATSLEKLASLKPAFIKDGTVTAGNSSGINDGAAAMLLASEEAVKLFNLQPLARVAGMGVAGVDPSIMGIGPVPASHKALKRAGITKNDLSLIELNEAFAAQSIACIQELELDSDKVNVNGGAIALGHPLGCSGTRIAGSLVHEIHRNQLKYGLATMCVGVGQGASIVFEGC